MKQGRLPKSIPLLTLRQNLPNTRTPAYRTASTHLGFCSPMAMPAGQPHGCVWPLLHDIPGELNTHASL